jgi:hypothetical protein
MGKVWALTDDGSSPATNETLINIPSPKITISGFAEDQGGEIYIIGNNNGKLYELTSSADVENNSLHSNFTLIADRTFLDANHPGTYIHFILPENQHIVLSLIDEKGVEIRRILDREMQRGEQSFQLNTNLLANGIYFVRLVGSADTEVLKMTVRK